MDAMLPSQYDVSKRLSAVSDAANKKNGGPVPCLQTRNPPYPVTPPVTISAANLSGAMTFSEPLLRWGRPRQADPQNGGRDTLADSPDEFSFDELMDDLISDRTMRSRSWLSYLPPLAEVCCSRMWLMPAEAESSRLTQLAALLEKGEDIHAIDPSYGRRALHWACMMGSDEDVQFLLRAGALSDLNLPDFDGATPLECVLHSPYAINRAPVVESLLLAGADLALLPGHGRQLLCADFLTLELARLLLRQGGDVNTKGAMGETPLMLACRDGNLALAQLLVRHGALVGRDADQDFSVLGFARAAGGPVLLFIEEQIKRDRQSARANTQ